MAVWGRGFLHLTPCLYQQATTKALSPDQADTTAAGLGGHIFKGVPNRHGVSIWLADRVSYTPKQNDLEIVIRRIGRTHPTARWVGFKIRLTRVVGSRTWTNW